MEEWRPVVGHEKKYEVSSLGRIRSLDRMVEVKNHFRYKVKRCKGRLLVPWIGSHGYLMVTLSRATGTVLLHRLICEAFHGKQPAGQEVCHGPRGKLDNRAKNLCWGTRSKNCGDDKKRDGSLIWGEKHYNAKLTDEQAKEIMKHKGCKTSMVAARFDVAPRTIRDIWNNKTWKHLF